MEDASRNICPASVLPEVYSQHFEELQSLWSQRQRAIRSPDYTAADVAELDERIEAHVDGLLLGGDAAVSQLDEQLAADDPLTVFAAAYVLLRMPLPAAAERVAVALQKAEPEKLDGFRPALCHGPIGHIQTQLRTIASTAATPAAAVALEAIAFHGLERVGADRIAAFVDHDDPLVRRIGWQIVALEEPA